MEAALGLNLHHDTSACLIINGKIIAAEEERWTNVKHNRSDRFQYLSFPTHSLEYCLKAGGVKLDEIKTIWCPSMQPADPTAIWLGDGKEQILSFFPENLHDRVKFISHHTAHIIAGYLVSPFEIATGLCVDAGGSILGMDLNGRERITGYYLTSHKLERIYHLLPTYKQAMARSAPFPVRINHSLGHFYRNFAMRCILPEDELEGSMMAMSAFNKDQRLYKEILRFVSFESQGIIQVAPPLGSYMPVGSINIGGLEWSTQNIQEKSFEMRAALANSVQRVFEEAVIHIARHLQYITKGRNLVFSGGCALNCRLNGILAERAGFQNLYIPAAPHDAGTAVGAALFSWCYELKKARLSPLKRVNWGPAIDSLNLNRLSSKHFQINHYDNENDLLQAAANLLAKYKIVAWAKGNMEFGPRALGQRSLLAHPGSTALRDRINKAKKRANFRPLAPCILEEDFDQWFTGNHDYFMNRTAQVKRERHSMIPGVIHVDGSARVQIVPRESTDLHALLAQFKRITGLPCLINTSLNLKGKPIVRTADQAFEVFKKLSLDAIVVGNILISKVP